jgi:hypothetical protein
MYKFDEWLKAKGIFFWEDDGEVQVELEQRCPGCGVLNYQDMPEKLDYRDTTFDWKCKKCGFVFKTGLKLSYGILQDD